MNPVTATIVPISPHPHNTACILIADCECMFVHVHRVCMHAHASSPFSSKEQGNRVTLCLIRKLMHRKSRQRHCSPSARSAGENNLHIGRLMDTFIGSTDRGIEGEEEEREENSERKGEGL